MARIGVVLTLHHHYDGPCNLIMVNSKLRNKFTLTYSRSEIFLSQGFNALGWNKQSIIRCTPEIVINYNRHDLGVVYKNEEYIVYYERDEQSSIMWNDGNKMIFFQDLGDGPGYTKMDKGRLGGFQAANEPRDIYEFWNEVMKRYKFIN